MTAAFDHVRAGDSAERLLLERVALPTPPPAVPERGWAPAEVAMAEIVDSEPDDIAGVLTRLIAVQKVLDSLPPTPALNRVAAFNSLYYTITDRVAKLSPYTTDKVVRTRNAADAVYTQQGGAGLKLALTRRKAGTITSGFTGAITLGLDPSATPAGVGGGAAR